MTTTPTHTLTNACGRVSRRRFLRQGGAGLALGAGAATGLLAASAAQARQTARRADETRSARFVHAHTGERFSAVYYEGGAYVTAALAWADWVLRDVTIDKSMTMSNQLIDLLGRIHARLDGREMVITSGYRSQATNEALRRVNRRAARRSLHIEGKAADFYSPGVPASTLARIAVEEGRGGVGQYRRHRFIHVDVGPARHWRR